MSGKRTETTPLVDELQPPRLLEPVDLDAHLRRLPPDASCKGMFFKTIFELGAGVGSPAELARAAGIPVRRYTPFLDYPMRDNLRLTVEVARRAYPQLTLGEALAHIGRTSFSTFLGSHVGRVLVLAAGDSVGDVLALAPKAYRLSMSFGEVRVVSQEPRRVVFACRDLPAFIETYQAGTLQGVFDHFGVAGQMRVSLDDIANGVMEASW